jgi:hypothetical protein
MSAYDESRDEFIEEVDRSSHQLHKGNRIAVQNMGMGLIVGGSKIGLGVPLTIAGVKYADSAQTTNQLIFAGAVSYMTGSSLAFLDNARIQLKRELDNHKLAKEHKLPGQLIQSRLDKLAAVESKL